VYELPTAQASVRETALTPESVLPFDPASGLGTTLQFPHELGTEATARVDGSHMAAATAMASPTRVRALPLMEDDQSTHRRGFACSPPEE
jgi:hypothetical protein